MSFLTEIISAASKVEISTLTEKTPDLVLLIEETKNELLNYLDKVFVKYSQQARKGTNFSGKIDSSTATLAELEQCLNDITKQEIVSVQNDIISYDKKLAETKEEIKILKCLIEVHDNFASANSSLKLREYSKTIELINVIKESMDLLELDDTLLVLKDIRNQVARLKEQLFNEMDDNVRQCLQYSSDGNKISFQINNVDMLEKLFLAYAQLDDHIPILNDVARFLWEHVFCPIVNSKITANVKLIEDSYVLDIEIISKTTKSGYKNIFENVIVVLNYFEQCFKYQLQNCTTLEYIGNDIRDNLSELLIKNCLNDTIPNNSEQLQEYSAVIKDVEILESKLIATGIFSENMTSLSDHAKKVDEHYIRKKCQRYLKMAEDIMKKDLHNMTEIGEPVDLKDPFKLDQDVFYQKSISKSCLELMEFVEEILKQILETSDPCSLVLYHTVQIIFAEYPDKVKEHHQKLLETIPQYVALFLNNCVCLSYKLTVWDEVYGATIKKVLKTEESIFKNEVYRLKEIGNKTFQEFVEHQIKQLQEIMKESGLMNTGGLEELEPITEKCIRQCLRQQELLRTVWHKVLSYPDYNKTLGTTMNFLCKSIIDAVLKFEDISSKAGDQLVDILKVIFTRGPKLFTDPKDIFMYVENWYKLNELSFLLSSNLMEIADRWADGKGPLAIHFKADELKRLIKALFQNTGRRAAVLAKIKDVY